MFNYSIGFWCGQQNIVTHTNKFTFLKHYSSFVTTLALGLRPKQMFARVRAKREAWESNLMLLGV